MGGWGAVGVGVCECGEGVCVGCTSLWVSPGVGRGRVGVRGGRGGVCVE